MKTALGFLAVATFLAAPSLSTAQSSEQSDGQAMAYGIQASPDELSPEVQLYIGRGDELIGRLRYDAAAREYARAAEVARRDGHLPSWTTWKVANTHYYAGNLVGAAAALDQLSDEAAKVGDLEVEALAIYYAAWLDGKAGLKTEATTRLARLESLLRSRYMPVAVRDRLSGWLKTSREVAAVSAQ